MATTTEERAARDFEQATTASSEGALGATQPVIGDLTELTISTAKENARLAAEVQMAAIDAFRESQASIVRWQAFWPEALIDPMRLYPRAFVELVDTAQRTLVLMGTNARVVA